MVFGVRVALKVVCQISSRPQAVSKAVSVSHLSISPSPSPGAMTVVFWDPYQAARMYQPPTISGQLGSVR